MDTLMALGFTRDEAEQLRRISLTLHRWHELECGMDSCCISRGRLVDGEFVYDDDGAPFYEFAGASGRNRYQRIPDRETGALRRLNAIIGQRNGRPALVNGRLCAAPGGPLGYHVQTDPRGAALYILRPDDVPAGKDVDSYYSRGICVY
jgi:hypothetical protein